MSVRAAKLNLAAATLQAFGPAYSHNKKMLLPAERAAFEHAVRFTLKTFADRDEARRILAEHAGLLDRLREQAENARLARERKAKGEPPVLAEQTPDGAGIAK